MIIIDLPTIASFTLSIFMGLSWFIADPARPNKWEIELERIRCETIQVDGFIPLKPSTKGY